MFIQSEKYYVNFSTVQLRWENCEGSDCFSESERAAFLNDEAFTIRLYLRCEARNDSFRGVNKVEVSSLAAKNLVFRDKGNALCKTP